jgi:hypothetical protein
MPERAILTPALLGKTTHFCSIMPDRVRERIPVLELEICLTRVAVYIVPVLLQRWLEYKYVVYTPFSVFLF